MRMAATWCRSQTPLNRAAVRNGRRTEPRSCLTRFPGTAGKYMWPTWPNGGLESWSQISPASVRPHWSRDGKWIYFRSQEPGRMGVYRCPASGGDAVVISKDTDGYNPQESFDGKTVYFASHEEQVDAEESGFGRRSRVAESEVDGLPRVSGSSIGLSLQVVSILFLPRRPNHSATLISPAGRYGQSLKWTAISAGTFGLSGWPLDPLFTGWRDQAATSCSSITFSSRSCILCK